MNQSIVPILPLPETTPLTDAEHLVQTLTSYACNLTHDLRSNIAFLDGYDQNFSKVANQLIVNGTAGPKWIAHWVYSVPKTYNTVKNAARMSADFGIDYTATEVVLEDAMLLTSLGKLGHINGAVTTDYTKAGHALLLQTAPQLRPDLLASIDTVDRYYHSLITATSIINPRDEYQQFEEEAPAFIAWAKDHEDITLLLEAATRTQCLNRTTIESFMPLIRSTQPALRDGLI